MNKNKGKSKFFVFVGTVDLGTLLAGGGLCGGGMYWRSVENNEENGPEMFAITSAKQVQTASDAGIFGVKDGKITLQQMGSVYYRFTH